MKTRYAIAVGTVLLAVVGVTIAQQGQPKAVPIVPGPTATVTPHADPHFQRPTAQPAAQDPLVVPAPRQQATAVKPEDLTIDQLIEAVDGFREQKAEIEKKERAYLKVLHKKAEKQKEKIDGLDGDGQPVPPALVPGPVAPSTSYNIPPAIGNALPTGSN